MKHFAGAFLRHSIIGIFFLLFPGKHCSAQLDSLINSGYHINKAQVFIDSNRLEHAIREYLFIDPRDTNYTLSLTKLADAYLMNKQNEEAINICKVGLQHPSPYRAELLVTKGMAYSANNEFRVADSIFIAGQKEFPFRPAFYIQQGKTYFNQQLYAETEGPFFKSLEISPFNSSAHLYLGILAMLRGEKVRGMMAFGIYMALNNTANKQLVTLENFIKGELTDEFTVQASTTNSFTRLDGIIRSKIAMEEAYKARIPINVGIVKQYQLLFDQIKTHPLDAKDPWAAFYLPIYKNLVNGNVHDAFVYHILHSTTFKNVAAWKEKNKKLLEQFYSTINTSIKQFREQRTLDEQWGYKEPVHLWFSSNGFVEAIGQKNDKNKNIGKWYYFDDNGTQIARGMYNNQGEKIGFWEYHDNRGILTSTENFETGEIIRYHENGLPRQKYTLKNKSVEGTYYAYFENGTLQEKLEYHNGMRHGNGEIYSIEGKVLQRYTYVQDSLHGKYEGFYNSGELRRVNNYAHDLFQGDYVTYHRNGKIASKGNYVSGNAEGVWNFYYDNGQLSETGAYKNDLPSGEFNYYERDGNLKEKRSYNEKGEFHGEIIVYNNGIKHYRQVYENDVMVESTYYDKQGAELINVKDKKGNIQSKSFFPTGQVRSEYANVKGQATGIWKYYYRTGELESEYNHKEGKLDGEAKEYYKDGTIKIKLSYSNGELSGLYEAFHPNGKLKTKGWYVDGKQEQQWTTFSSNGNLKTDYYWLNGVATGYSLDYDPDGNPVYRIENGNELIRKMERLNAKGDVISKWETSADHSTSCRVYYANGKIANRLDFLNGNYHGQLGFYLSDGKPFILRKFSNGKQDGIYENYYVDGSRECIGQNEDGNATGMWKWYYPNKTLWTIGKYVNDEKDSLWTYYHENGTLSSVTHYKDGEKSGLSRIYSPDGRLVLEKMYEDGDLISYRLPGKNGNAWIPAPTTGSIKAFYPDGRIAIEESYLRGQLHGEKKMYYANGAIFYQDNFNKGLFEGISISNHPNGKPKIKRAYIQDEINGRCEYRKADGTLERVENYACGYLHGIAEVYSQGKKLKEYKFRDGIPVE